MEKEKREREKCFDSQFAQLNPLRVVLDYRRGTKSNWIMGPNVPDTETRKFNSKLFRNRNLQRKTGAEIFVNYFDAI